MAPAADVASVCYAWGYVGWALVWMALSSGKSMWLSLGWLASRTQELYFWAVCATGAFSFTAQWILSTLVFLSPGELPSCSSNIRAAPDLTVWLLWHFWVLAFAHERFFAVEWSWWVAARRVLCAVLVPVVLVLSGNSRWEYVGVGAACGLGAGVLCAALCLFVWLPRMPDVAQYTHELGIFHHADMLRAYHRRPDNTTAGVFH